MGRSFQLHVADHLPDVPLFAAIIQNEKS